MLQVSISEAIFFGEIFGLVKYSIVPLLVEDELDHAHGTAIATPTGLIVIN